VYRAQDQVTGQSVALKIIAISGVDAGEEARFRREGRLLAGLTHPGIVRVVAFGQLEDGQPYVAMEWLEGEDIAQRQKRRPLTLVQALEVAASVADALSAAHDAGIVHRDVKPSNVMLTRDAPGCKLLDFGIAKLFESAPPVPDSSRTGGTETGAIMGTPAYMAPEQVEGTREVTASADIYALGVVLFELLAGRHPFDERTPWGIAYSHMCVEPPDVRVLASAVPAKLAAVIARCLAKEPAGRPTAEQLGATLATCADELGAPALDAVVSRNGLARTAPVARAG
jgi:serine/threonine protein kinase